MINGSSIGSITSKAAEAGLRSFLTILNMAAISIISLSIAKRLDGVSFTSYDAFVKSFTVTRVMLLLTYIFSYCFVFSSAILLNGVGIAYSDATCEAAIILCIVLYAITKVTLYLFLVERVHLVREPNHTRRHSNLYRFNLCLLIGFGIVFGLMIGFRKALVKGVDVARTCYIGIDMPASIPLLSYDFLMNLYLTTLFVVPLWKPNLRSHFSVNLQRLAKRTSIGCLLALMVTTINLATLSVFRGEELGAICLACCTTDTILNALILFWVTSPHIHETSTSMVAGPVRPPEGAGEMTLISSTGPEFEPRYTKRSYSGSTAADSHFGDTQSLPPFGIAIKGEVGQDPLTPDDQMGQASLGDEPRRPRKAKNFAGGNNHHATLINDTVDADLQRLESIIELER